MADKIEMVISYNSDLGYIIDFDEGLLDEVSCVIDEQDRVSINYGNISYYDYNKTTEIRKQIIKKMLFDNLIGEESDFLLSSDKFYFEGIFKRLEKFIVDKNIIVEENDIDFSFGEKEYETFFDKETGVVTIIINDKRISDVFGISVNKDNTFELYIKRPKEELTKRQIEILQNTVKDFIYKNLKLKINFGRNLNGPLKIGGLYDSTMKLINNLSYKDFEEERVNYGK